MTFEKILKSIWNEFIYGGHLISLGAASIVFSSAILLSIKITWDCLVITYLIFYLIYLYNRFKEIDVDYLTNPQRTEHLQTYVKQIPIIFYFVILIVTVGLIYFTNFPGLIFGLSLLSFGLLYTIIFKKFTKKIVIFKDLFVSTVFSLLVPFLIVYYSFSLTTPSFIAPGVILMAFIFLKAFTMQVFFDVKDMEGDKKEGLLTFPVIFGKERILNALKIINILITVPIPIFSFYFNIFPKSVLMLLFTVPFVFYCFSLVKKGKYFGYILGSGEFILWPILLLIGEVLL